jgi:thiamine-phosphate pyrophosphorylase
MQDKAERRRALLEIDLYPVITSEFCLGRPPLEVLAAIAEGGARIVQLREKQMPMRDYFELALAAREICDAHGMLLMVNDHVDLALAVGADGVHLGQDDFPLSAARELGPHLLLGASTHSREEALRAQAEGADYVNLGPLFATQTKAVLPCPPLGLEILDEVPPLLHIPFTVMGGIKRQHLAALVARGATRIAMVTEITGAEDVVRRIREIRTCLARKTVV